MADVCVCVLFDWYQMKCLQKSKKGRKEKAIYAPMLPNSNYRKHMKKMHGITHVWRLYNL